MAASHSAEFVAEMKKKLQAEETMLVSELERIAQPAEKGSYTAKYPDYGEHEDENATEIADFQALSATTEATEARLNSVREALANIEAGTYGVTADGTRIPEERLRANPAATTIIT